MSTPVSFGATIERLLAPVIQQLRTMRPDAKHNVGSLLSSAYMWDIIAKTSKARAEEAWKALKEEGLIDTDGLSPGEHVVLSSPSLVCGAKISNPVRRFDADYLANKLNQSKYKIPIPVAKEMIESAKQPGKSSVTLWIAEKKDD